MHGIRRLVMDWGVAKLKAAAEPSAILGTPGYMAPEQVRGDTALTDERSDVYALGAVLAFLLTGLTRARPLQAIVRKATAADPSQRYHHVVLLATDLARYRAGLPVEAFPEQLIDRSRRLVTKYRVPLTLVLAYVIMRALLVLIPRF